MAVGISDICYCALHLTQLSDQSCSSLVMCHGVMCHSIRLNKKKILCLKACDRVFCFSIFIALYLGLVEGKKLEDLTLNVVF